MENQKIIIVLPAYNAGKTLEKTLSSLSPDLVAEIILVDDSSSDNTLEVANNLKITSLKHEKNLGYGANQKTCYKEALKREADVIIMLHPDGQYDPRMIKGLLMPIELDICDITLGNRIRSRKETLKRGMPLIKYVFNRWLTFLQNIVLGQNLGEFSTGYRAYKRAVLESINWESFSNDFVFDSEFLIAAAYGGFRMGDVPVPTIYTADSSQINFKKSVKYTLETVIVVVKYILQKSRLFRFAIFKKRESKYGK